MDADELNKKCEEFNEFMKKRKENGERIGVMPQILMHEELIDTLVAQGAIQLQLHVTRTLEFIENHIVHL